MPYGRTVSSRVLIRRRHELHGVLLGPQLSTRNQHGHRDCAANRPHPHSSGPTLASCLTTLIGQTHERRARAVVHHARCTEAPDDVVVQLRAVAWHVALLAETFTAAARIGSATIPISDQVGFAVLGIH